MNKKSFVDMILVGSALVLGATWASAQLDYTINSFNLPTVSASALTADSNDSSLDETATPTTSTTGTTQDEAATLGPFTASYANNAGNYLASGSSSTSADFAPDGLDVTLTSDGSVATTTIGSTDSLTVNAGASMSTDFSVATTGEYLLNVGYLYTEAFTGEARFGGFFGTFNFENKSESEPSIPGTDDAQRAGPNSAGTYGVLSQDVLLIAGDDYHIDFSTFVDPQVSDNEMESAMDEVTGYLSLDPLEVPEPSTWAMLVSGFLTFGFFLGRNRLPIARRPN